MKNASSSTQNEEERIAENKKFAQDVSRKLEKMQSKSKIDALSTYVEIGNGIHQPTCIAYKENGFKDQFENALRKWGISEIGKFLLQQKN